MTRRLFLDMDGVLADFDRAYEERFGAHPRSHDDKVLWANIDGCEEFFRSIHPCAGALDFYASVKHLSPAILTACPKTGYEKAAQHKREWVREHLGPDVTVLPVMGGANKPLFMHAPGDVLIDDYRRNTEAWAAAGGVAILHRDWNATRIALDVFIDNGDFSVTEELVGQLRGRAIFGLGKYKQTLASNPLRDDQWLQHLIEELLDAAGYAQTLRRRLARGKLSGLLEARAFVRIGCAGEVAGFSTSEATADEWRKAGHPVITMVREAP